MFATLHSQYCLHTILLLLTCLIYRNKDRLVSAFDLSVSYSLVVHLWNGLGRLYQIVSVAASIQSGKLVIFVKTVSSKS